jgi:hypothetical protein
VKIQEKDIYHGAALTQIVEHDSFKALNRASNKYGHYLINADRHVFIKYRTADASPWQFIIQPDEVSAICLEAGANRTIYLCLVCGITTVCALNIDEIKTVIDVESSLQQWIRVEVPNGGSCHVSGSSGKLQRTVPHNSFPNKVFS